MLVAHDERRVDLWRRLDERWTQLSFREGEEIVLVGLDGLRIAVDDVYLDPLAGR